MDFNTTGAMRSPFSPRVRQSISGRRPGGLSSLKKSQSKFMQSQSEQTGDVIYKSPSMTLETYGAPMPVMVTEALAFASGDISVRLSTCGWCWVVSGRRILAWEQSPIDTDEDPANVTGISAARELTLPQTDLAHKADLVVLFYGNDSQMPSCIGVSPEGVIRYWPSVGQEEVYVDVTCELAGQECEKLGDYTSSGLILATTTCTVVLLTPTVLDGRATVTCCTLRPPSGWLGGIGRRVSLLFFGSMPAHTDTRLVGAVWAGDCVWLVARGPALQVWRPPALLHHHSLRGPLALAARPHLQPHGDLNSLEIMALDVQASGNDGFLLLIAAVNVTRSPEMRYAIAHINVEDPSSPRVSSFVPVRNFPQEADEPPRLLPFGNKALLYTSKYIALISLAATTDAEVVEAASGDRVLSAARSPHGPALFTAAHGLLALRLHSHAASVYTRTHAPARTRAVHRRARPARTASALARRVSIHTPPHGPALFTAAHGLLALRLHSHAASVYTRPRTDPRCSPPRTACSHCVCTRTPRQYTHAPARTRAVHRRARPARTASALARRVSIHTPPHGPALFTAAHGLLALRLHSHAAAACDSPIGSSSQADMYEGNLSLYEIDPCEMSAVVTDACGKLKTAFLFHLRRDSTSCRELLDELFPPPGQHAPQEPDVDAPLDRTVLAVATETLDDMPAGDPRWKRSSGQPTHVPLGSSTALQIEAQLLDKQRALALFFDFLRATGLWQRLGLVTVEDEGVASTTSALCQAWERVRGAAALRRLQRGTHAAFIDSIICEAVRGWQHREEESVHAALSSGALSPTDACYRRVSRLPAVLLMLTRPVPSDRPAALAVLSGVLSEMLKARKSWQNVSPPPLGSSALLTPALHLIRKSLTEFENKGGDATLRAQVCEAAAGLADVLLAGAQASPAYPALRTDLIRPFVEQGEPERAAALAEKYQEFSVLVELCVSGGDTARLCDYVDRYSDRGMAEVAYEWMSRKGGAAAAALVRGAGGGARLTAWLRRERPDLLSLHQLHRGDHAAAAHTFSSLAHAETDNLERMTTLASLSKLCMLVSDAPEEAPAWDAVQRRLALAEQHRALPSDVMPSDVTPQRVMQPHELVEVYLKSENKSLTEYDYKKALDLTEGVEDPEQRQRLRLRVWCASVLRDDWAACKPDDPAAELMQRTFFKLIDLVNVMGDDLDVLLPELPELLSAPELAALAADSKFHYLLKYGYECLHQRTADQSPDDSA
ncbi:nuclear pore complex protein Nup133 isoform X1 [Bombyx mandarina]|uniref:Nuclear pore complex protein Nup133 isoform X1 n=1 Tax=Bombyx mandarina TaxID=7092 RepID=A0A6J2JXG3_BOMMA|nr:nuclear pore complex protein Nup133 isoform X1 [Bombyx mandarina]